MKFSVGFWDSIFGDKIVVELPDSDGKNYKKKSLEKMA